MKLERYDEAESAYRKAIELEGDCFVVWGHLGDLLGDCAGRAGEAEEAYRKAVELKPDYARAWAKLGRILDKEFHRGEDAERAYRKAIELEPESAWAWDHYGQLLQSRERYDEAEKAYLRAIELGGTYPPCPRIYLGDIYSANGREEDAEHQYRDAIEQHPECARAWAQLGKLLHEKLERYDEAEEAYRKAIELDKEVAAAWAGLGLLLDEKLERYDEAEKAYRKALEVEPENRLGLQKLTILLLTKLERPSEAMELAQKKLAQETEDARMRNSFAWAFYEHASLELLPDAERWAQEAVELKPENGNYRHTLASILCRLGKVQEAIEQGRKYLEDVAIVEKTVDDAIDLFVGLAARGVAKDALKILEGSASCEVLEPLIVGLRMYLGEDVQVATEIMEIGKDVAKRIEERRGRGGLKNIEYPGHK
jgi:tetratricopeptide (TPR) repeat protein